MQEDRNKRRKHWFTTLEVAQLLSISIRTVERWRAEGKFTPSNRTRGGHSRYSCEQVKKMKEHKKIEQALSSRLAEAKETKKQKKSKIKKERKIIEPDSIPRPFELPSHEDFVKYVYAFLEEHDIKPSMFGRKVLSDSGSIQRLKEGTDPRLSTMLKICEWIERTKKDEELKKMFQKMME